MRESFDRKIKSVKRVALIAFGGLLAAVVLAIIAIDSAASRDAGTDAPTTGPASASAVPSGSAGPVTDPATVTVTVVGPTVQVPTTAPALDLSACKAMLDYYAKAYEKIGNALDSFEKYKSALDHAAVNFDTVAELQKAYTQADAATRELGGQYGDLRDDEQGVRNELDNCKSALGQN